MCTSSGDRNQRTRLRRLPARLVRPIRYAFVAPTGFDGLRAACEKNRAMILRGPSRLRKTGNGHPPAHRPSRRPPLPPGQRGRSEQAGESIETDLKGQDRIEQGAGFLLHRPRDFADLYGSVLQGLEEVLEAG